MPILPLATRVFPPPALPPRFPPSTRRQELVPPVPRLPTKGGVKRYDEQGALRHPHRSPAQGQGRLGHAHRPVGNNGQQAHGFLKGMRGVSRGLVGRAAPAAPSVVPCPPPPPTPAPPRPNKPAPGLARALTQAPRYGSRARSSHSRARGPWPPPASSPAAPSSAAARSAARGQRASRASVVAAVWPVVSNAASSTVTASPARMALPRGRPVAGSLWWRGRNVGVSFGTRGSTPPCLHSAALPPLTRPPVHPSTGHSSTPPPFTEHEAAAPPPTRRPPRAGLGPAGCRPGPGQRSFWLRRRHGRRGRRPPTGSAGWRG